MFLKCEVEHIAAIDENKYDVFFAYIKNKAHFTGKLVSDKFINPGTIIDISVYDIIAQIIAEQSKSATLFGAGPVHITDKKLFWLIYQIRESNNECSIVPRGVYVADVLNNEIKITMIDYDVVHIDEKLQPRDINPEYIEALKSQKRPLSCKNNLHLIARYEPIPIATALRAIVKHIDELEKLQAMDNCPKCGKPLSYIISTKNRKYCYECDMYFKISGGELIEIAPLKYDGNKKY